MSAVLRNGVPIAATALVGREDGKALDDLALLADELAPVHSPASRQQLTGLLSPAGQAMIAERITDDERKQAVAAADRALGAWDRIEPAFLNKIGIDSETFVSEVYALRSGGTLSDQLRTLSSKCRGIIRNVEWVNAFVWQLPVMDPQRAERYHNVARVMAAIFYLEQHAKNISSGSVELPTGRIVDLMNLLPE